MLIKEVTDYPFSKHHTHVLEIHHPQHGPGVAISVPGHKPICVPVDIAVELSGLIKEVIDEMEQRHVIH